MSYRKPGPRVSRRFVTLTALLIGVLALFRLYTYYKEAAAPIPPGVLLAGVDGSRYKERSDIRAHLESIFTQPIGVRFEDQLLVLDPAQIGFAIDADGTIDDAARYLEGLDFVDIAIREALGLAQTPRNVPVRYRYDDDALRAWLQDVAAQHNYAPIPARVDAPPVPVTIGLATPAPAITTAITTADTLSPTQPLTPSATATPAPIRELLWLEGTPGQEVDIEAAIPVVLAALASTDARMADLPLTPIPAPAPTMADLQAQLPRVLDTFPVFTAVAVHDLTTGERAQADGDAAFSGMTVLKPALAIALMEALPNGIAAGDTPEALEAQQVGEWIDRAIGQGDDTAANAALAWYGGGDQTAGAARLTAFLQRLGLQNTFVQAGINVPFSGARLLTPSNQRERPNTRPDTNAQTTPDDMATLLGAIYECTLDKGLLRTTFPTTITPEECASVLFYMSHNELRDSLWRGLPLYDNQWLVHQQGLSFEQHGNAALAWGPAGPYAISIFIFNPSLTDSSTSNAAILDLSRMIWDFFAFRRAAAGVYPGDPPALTPPPGYRPIDEYVPSGANPAGE
jgi:hypothetical protein